MSVAAKNTDGVIFVKTQLSIPPRELVSVITQTCKKYSSKKYARFSRRLGIPKSYGVSRPDLRRITKNIISMVQYGSDEFKELIFRLGKINNNEERTIGMMLLSEIISRNIREALNYSLKEIKHAINNINSWDLADFIGTDIIGPYLAYDAKNLNEVKKWSKDKNPWIRRIYAVSIWGYFNHTPGISKRKTERAMAMFNNCITDSSKPVKSGTEWSLRNICKRDWQNCYSHYKFWSKIKDPTVAWIIKKSSIFMPTKFRKRILSKIRT
ncbi:MAG: DNA alkylation repair protein [bacterium]